MVGGTEILASVTGENTVTRTSMILTSVGTPAATFNYFFNWGGTMMKRIIFLLLFTAPAAAQLPNRISVKDYGAKAVLGTDDTPAITAAINAAIARPQYLGETVVYFPPPGYYDIKTPLVLPASPKR